MAGLALAAMVGSASRADRAWRHAADSALGAAAAGYLSLVVPSPSEAGPPPRLLSAASALEASPFWPGVLQVGWGPTGLLPGTARPSRAEGRIPLPAPAAERRVSGPGWVLVRDALPPRDPPVLAGGLALATLLGLVLAVQAAREATHRRWMALGLVAVAGGALGLALGRELEQTAAAATEVPLLAARRLVEIASTAPGVRRTDLDRIWPELRPAPSEAVRTEGMRRISDGEGTVAVAIAGLRGGAALELRATERSLGWVWRTLAAWHGTVVLALATSVWPGRVPRRGGGGPGGRYLVEGRADAAERR